MTSAKRRGPLAVMFVLLAVPGAVFADRASEVAALEARCESEREAKIRPLREMEIAKCRKEEGKDPQYCEKFWSDYGNAVRTSGGAMTPRMFADLPSCVAAFKARREFELNGR